MGLYFGKVRASAANIPRLRQGGRRHQWIRLANDTAVAVDQLGMRQGAVAVYLDAWHRDLPSSGSAHEQRRRPHEGARRVPGRVLSGLLLAAGRDNIEGDWCLMCPHEILTVKGYALEDCYGGEWTRKYL